MNESAVEVQCKIEQDGVANAHFCCFSDLVARHLDHLLDTGYWLRRASAKEGASGLREDMSWSFFIVSSL